MQNHQLAPKHGRRPLSVWELPKLATLVHTYRKSEQIAAKLRPHFAAILAFVYRNRLVIADQVRRRFPQHLRSDRTARRHLAEMESLGLLGVQPVTNVSPLMPKPYFVTRTGLRYLRQSFAERGKPCEPFARDRKRAGQSFQHVWHELATTEFLLSVWETIDQRSDLELLKMERRSLVKHPAFRRRHSLRRPASIGHT